MGDKGVSKEQAMSVDRFHANATCHPHKTYKWRRNGKTQTWKTRPGDFRVPVKFGLYSYSAITQDNADQWHTEGECQYGHN